MTTNFQLEKVAKKLKLKKFRGVVFTDQLSKMIPLKKECGILGSKTSKEDNMHWTCWWKNGKNKIVFDSFGLTPAREIVRYLKSPIIYSTFQIQQFNESICGQYCMHVLNRLNRGEDYTEIILDLINNETF